MVDYRSRIQQSIDFSRNIRAASQMRYPQQSFPYPQFPTASSQNYSVPGRFSKHYIDKFANHRSPSPYSLIPDLLNQTQVRHLKLQQKLESLQFQKRKLFKLCFSQQTNKKLQQFLIKQQKNYQKTRQKAALAIQKFIRGCIVRIKHGSALTTKTKAKIKQDILDLQSQITVCSSILNQVILFDSNRHPYQAQNQLILSSASKLQKQAKSFLFRKHLYPNLSLIKTYSQASNQIQNIKSRKSYLNFFKTIKILYPQIGSKKIQRRRTTGGKNRRPGYNRPQPAKKTTYSNVNQMEEIHLEAPEPVLPHQLQGLWSMAEDLDGSLHAVCSTGYVYKVTQKAIEEKYNTGGQPTMLVFDANGTGYVSDMAHQRILQQSENQDGIQITEIIKDYKNHSFIGPNSLVYSQAENAIYFTDSGPIGETSLVNPKGSVFRYDLENQSIEAVAFGSLSHPSGIAMTPDCKIIYVAETFRNRILRISIRERPSVSVFKHFQGRLGPTALAVSDSGNLYVARYDFHEYASDGLVSVLNSDGQSLGSFSVPDAPEITDLTFSSEDRSMVYISEFSRKMSFRATVPVEII